MMYFLKNFNFFCLLFQFFNILNVLYNFGIFNFFFLEILMFFENFEFLINNWIMHKDYLKFIDAYYY
jgi:hypothetical protein